MFEFTFHDHYFIIQLEMVTVFNKNNTIVFGSGSMINNKETITKEFMDNPKLDLPKGWQ